MMESIGDVVWLVEVANCGQQLRMSPCSGKTFVAKWALVYLIEPSAMYLILYIQLNPMSFFPRRNGV